MRTASAYPALIAILLLSTPVSAQILRGTVTDHATGRPMEGVLVELIDVTGHEPVETTTSATGVFSLLIPRDGSFMIRASHLGYLTFQTDALEVGTRDMVDVRLQLSVEPVDLDPIVVTVDRDSHLAEFERRRLRSGTGHFITREQIEGRPVSRPAELLVGVPDVLLRVQVDLMGNPQDRHIIYLQGSTRPCLAYVFIDGHEVKQTSNSTIDDLLNADWLGGVEIYATEAMTPAEYSRRGCGSVLFWTRARESGSRWRWIKGVAVAGFAAMALILTR